MRPKLLIGALALLLGAGATACASGSGSARQATQSLSATRAPTPSATPTRPPTAVAKTPSKRVTPSVTPGPTPTQVLGSIRPTSRVAPAPVLSAPPVPTVASPVVACRLASGTQAIGGRTVIVDLPARFPAPVVIDYHGGNQSAAQEHGYTGLGPLGAARGFIVVTPNGTNGLWNFSGTEPLPDDAAFTHQIAATLAFAGCSNGRVYAAGISDGADMAVAAGCRLAEVRAIFAVAPSITPRGSCARKSFLEVHGTADPIVPYSGSAAGSFADVPSEPVTSRLAFWTGGCSGPTAGISPGAGTSVAQWSCGGRSVQLATVFGGGHTWPGAVGPEPAAGLGARAAWSADALALSFFLTH